MGNKLLIFDFDGTLVDSLPLWGCVDKIFFDQRRGIKYSIEDIDFKPMSVEEAAVAAKDFYNLPDSIEEIKQEWIDIINELYITEDILRDNAKEIITLAKEKGYKVAIGSNNTLELITAYLKKENIEDYFDLILTADNVKNSKPEPDIYLEIAKRLNVKPENSIVVEDSLYGTLAGKEAGMYTYTIEEKDSIVDKEIILAITDKYIYNLSEIEL